MIELNHGAQGYEEFFGLSKERAKVLRDKCKAALENAGSIGIVYQNLEVYKLFATFAETENEQLYVIHYATFITAASYLRNKQNKEKILHDYLSTIAKNN